MILGVLFILVMINIVSAGVKYGGLDGSYSLGDIVNVQIEVTADHEINSFMKVRMSCGSISEDFYLSPLILGIGEDKTVEIPLYLSKDFLGVMKGSCKIVTKIGSTEYSSGAIDVSDLIIVSVDLNETAFDPGSVVFIEGKVTKKNGGTVSGGIEVSLINTTVMEIINVDGNNFSLDLIIPGDLAYGEYTLNTRAYEFHETSISNEGESNLKVTINQVLKQIELILYQQNVTPGENLTYLTHLYDQTANFIERDFEISLKDAEGELKTYLISSGVEDYIDFESDAVEGLWTMSASFDNVSSGAEFFVNRNVEVVFSVQNDTIVVTNVGNAPYSKEVRVDIGEDVVYKDVEVEIGETKSYKLNAPDGVYDIYISDEAKDYSKTGVSLTGNAVGIDEVNEGKLTIWVLVVVFIGIIFVLAAIFVILQFMNKKKKKGVIKEEHHDVVHHKVEHHKKEHHIIPHHEKKDWHMPFPIGVKEHKIPHPSGIKPEEHHKKEHHKPREPAIKKQEKKEIKEFDVKKKVLYDDFKNLDNVKLLEAEHSLVSKGSKEKSVFVGLKIKNFKTIRERKGIGYDLISDIIYYMSAKKGAVYQTHDYIIGIFIPRITKSYKNEKLGVSVGKKIVDEIVDHNRRYAEKINFGIGITSGSIIFQKEGDKVSFTSLGTELNNIKIIAEKAEKDILISEKVNKELDSSVKTVLKDDYWKLYAIDKMIDRGAHDKFINSFLKRQTEERKKGDNTYS